MFTHKKFICRVKGICSISDDLWYKTRSEICSTGWKVNLYLDKLLVSLLELQPKWLMASIRYIDAMDWGLVPTLGGADLKVVDTSRIQALLLLLWHCFWKELSSVPQINVSDLIVILIPWNKDILHNFWP